MKRLLIIIFAIIAANAATGQNYIQDGDRCFENSDYDCAITHYNNAFKYATGKDKQIAEIKLSRAKWCSEHIKSANQAFNNKNYAVAKEEYQKVLDSNPNDSYAQSQIVKCDNAINPPKLRKATSSELTDIWNNKYGVNPERRQRLINEGIDPDDAQRRINSGENKPASMANEAITLSVTNQNFSFPVSGGSELVDVNTNASDYQISLLPSWCSIRSKFSKLFSLVCEANNTGLLRSDWFKITAGDKVIMIYVSQDGNKNITSDDRSRGNNYRKKCFNCPNPNYFAGITAGYYSRAFDNLEGVRLGLRIEPLFKYGFGLNTGFNIDVFTSDSFKNSNQEEVYIFEINLPLHLEYRFNFSKWFNVFAYGGASMNFITNSFSRSETAPITLDFGGGLRINHLQFNIGRSLFLGGLDYGADSDFSSTYYHDYILSVSYMFR